MVHVYAGQVKVLQDKYNNEIFLSSGQHMRFWYLSHRQTVKAHNCPFKVSNLDIFPLLKSDMDLHSFPFSMVPSYRSYNIEGWSLELYK